MGNHHVKPDDKLNYINEEVISLRHGIRNFKRGIPRETQQLQVQNLARYATEVNLLKRRVKNKAFSRTMENISRTMNDILSIPVQDSELDSGAIETDSFIDFAINKRHSRSLTSVHMMKPKLIQDTITKHAPTIKDIDGKFKSIRPQIIVAIENKDSTQLRVFHKTIKVLATDLENLDVAENSPAGDKKEKLILLLTTFYQKISVALKDIRKKRDMDMMDKQRKNEASMQKLEEIRQEIEKADALLKFAVKNEKVDYIQRCLGDLTKISQKLSSIETMEEHNENIRMQMLDRITWLKKYASDSQLKGSQSDLTKAQSNYEELIKEIASGRNKDMKEIFTKLASLDDFVGGISHTDDTEVKQKTQLLNNIRETKSSMTSKKHEPSSMRGKINAVSRFCNWSANLEALRNHWNSIENDMKAGMKFSEKDIRKIVSVLGEIQSSMLNVRNELINSNNSRLGNKLNRSTPNLVTTDPIHKKFSSSLSVNHVSNSPLKVKIYELRAPKIGFANIDQSDKLTNSYLPDANTFSEIEEIRAQVNYIKEKFDETNDENHLRNKLETFKRSLEKYLSNNNDTIVKSVKLVLAEIQSLIREICILKRLKEIYLFGTTENIRSDLDKLRKIINDYPDMSTYHSFDSLAKRLNCSAALLSANTVMTTEDKAEILSRFQTISGILEKKTNIQQNLNILKEKVMRFSGAYRGVLYNKLEKDLNRILVDTSEYIENKKIADGITRETEKQLKILENRACIAQSFRGPPIESHIMETAEKMNNLKKELEIVRTELQSNRTNDVDSLRGLRSRLDLVTLDLYQLKNLNENEEQLKILMYNDIDSLKSSVDAKIALGENSMNTTMVQMGVTGGKREQEIIDEVKGKLDHFKKEVEIFIGTTSDKTFYELDEYCLILVSRMEDLEIAKGTELYSEKLNILRELYEYGDLLDKRALETEKIIQYERDCEDIRDNFGYYTRSRNELNRVSDKLNHLKYNLEVEMFNDQLHERKQLCSKHIDSIIDRINKMDNTSDSEERMKEFEKKETSEENQLSNTDILNKSNNLKHEVEKHNPTDDMGRTNGIKDSQNTKADHEHVEAVLRQLDEFDKKIAGMIPSQKDSLESDLKKFHIGLNEFGLSNKDKNIIMRKYNQVLNSLEKLSISKNSYIGSTAFLQDLANNSTKGDHLRNDSVSESLKSSERRIEKIESDIFSFNNSEMSDEYRQLEDSILKENVFLKKFDVPKDGPLHLKKIDLKRRIIECLEMLDGKVQLYEDISIIENRLDEFRRIIEVPITREQRNKLDESLISLQVELGKMTVDDSMAEKKLLLENEIVEYIKQMKNIPAQAL